MELIKVSVDLHWKTGFLLLLLLADLPSCVVGWSYEYEPKKALQINYEDETVQLFYGDDKKSDSFRILLVDGAYMLVGAKNAVYNVSLTSLESNTKISWPAQENKVKICTRKHKTQEECQNYIRVVVKVDPRTLLVCGTSAFSPRCRNYVITQLQGKTDYQKQNEFEGAGKCPFDPEHNSTAIYVNDSLYTATVTDLIGRDSIIYDNNHQLRTEQYDSRWLNDPNFVSSFDKDDKIYFFFRETATEHINCGKAIFSRVARVCKSDRGGKYDQFSWTSFFKARLNCSLPGEYPFYFDELQGTTEFGNGNFIPGGKNNGVTDMIYAVFTTPQNSIRASAVCAFRYSDIVKVFQSHFKGQETVRHNWLSIPLEVTPKPHPGQCINNSSTKNEVVLDFIKTHPLMDEAVPAMGGSPLIIHASFDTQFTQIAVDWHLPGVHRYYDVMFIGTIDGRVLKAVNKAGSLKKPDTVVIEDIQVFKDKQPVISLKLFRKDGKEKLIVVSKTAVVSIPLHRCEEKKTCVECVTSQDPYCAWDSFKCSRIDRRNRQIFQDIENAEVHGVCHDAKAPTMVSTTLTPQLPGVCVCPTVAPPKEQLKENSSILKNESVIRDTAKDDWGSHYGEEGNSQGNGPEVEEQKTYMASGFGTAEMLAIAVVMSVVLSIIVGFIIGYKVAQCRASRNIDSPFHERNISLSKRSNRLSSGDHTYFVPEAPKTVNYFVNMKSTGKLNSEMETKHVTKSNKVYL